MKHIAIIFSLLLIIFSSCTTINESNIEYKDTSLHFLFSDSSPFGTEIYAHYCDNVIASCEIEIKKDRCKNFIRFIFLKDSILATEDILFYEYPIQKKQEYNIDTIWDELIDSISVVRYILNYEGKILWKSDSMAYYTNYFPELQSLVPLKIH